MKRKITLLLVLMSLLLCLAVGASAAYELTISEDLQQVELGDKTYVRTNTTPLGEDFYYGYTASPILTEEQAALYQEVKLYYWNERDSVIRLEIHQTDGMIFQISYIREDLYESYMALLEQETYTVQFLHPYNNDTITEKSQLCGEATVLTVSVLRKATNFPVYANGAESLSIKKGWLMVINEEYYYVPLDENGLSPDEEPDYLPRVSAYKVTDPDLCARFDKAMDRYYNEGFGVLEDPEVSNTIASIFMLIIFGFLPLVVLAIFTVFACVSKTRVYRTMCIIVASCALLVLIILLLTVLIL